MANRSTPTVTDLDGNRGRICELRGDDREHPAAVLVELASGVRLTLPAALLHPQDDGGYLIDLRWADLAAAAERMSIDVPALQEEVAIGTRQVVRDRVRIRRHVVTEDKLLETPYWHERVEIERVPRDMFVEKIPEPRQEGDTLIIACVEEVVVVEKRLRVREELRVRVIREQLVDRRTVALRRHELRVEHDAEGAGAQPIDPTNPKSNAGGSS